MNLRSCWLLHAFLLLSFSTRTHSHSMPQPALGRRCPKGTHFVAASQHDLGLFARGSSSALARFTWPTRGDAAGLAGARLLHWEESEAPAPAKLGRKGGTCESRSVARGKSHGKVSVQYNKLCKYKQVCVCVCLHLYMDISGSLSKCLEHVSTPKNPN